MKATLSYKYNGDIYPDLKGKRVIVKEIADLAEIPYQLLKNRMGMKKKRALDLSDVCIEDKDLDQKKRTKRPFGRRVVADEDVTFACEWLRRPFV